MQPLPRFDLTSTPFRSVHSRCTYLYLNRTKFASTRFTLLLSPVCKVFKLASYDDRYMRYIQGKFIIRKVHFSSIYSPKRLEKFCCWKPPKWRSFQLTCILFRNRGNLIFTFNISISKGNLPFGNTLCGVYTFTYAFVPTHFGSLKFKTPTLLWKISKLLKLFQKF